MFLLSVPKCPTCLTNALHCASQMVTLIPVNNPYLVGDAVLILGRNYQTLIVLPPQSELGLPIYH